MAQHTSILQLILLCCVFSANSSFQSGLVLEMARILLENYCHPENLVGMQEAIQRAINSGEILQISDRKTLASVLTVGVQGALNDPRLVVSYEPNFIMAKTPSLRSVSAESLTRLMRKSVKMDLLENNTGYLRMDRIVGEQSATGFSHVLRDIWDKVAHSSALIFDLRYCTTGELSGVPFIISYFSDPELIHIDTVYNRPSNTTQEIWTVVLLGQRYGKNKDVIVLTSKHTNGAAEAVVYTLKHLKRAIIVGERTSGGSISVQTFRIASSDFYITVPVARSISPITGQSWEVSGVSPTINVMAKEALRKAKSLLAERRAIPKVLQSVSNIITRFYAFTGKVSVILQQLQSTDLHSVVSEKDLVRTLNQNIQSVSEDTRLIIKNRNENADIEEPSEHVYFTDVFESQGTIDFKVEVLPGNIGYLRFDIFISDVTKLDKSMSEKVWKPLKDTEILIIDLRYNTGGNSSSLSLILSYLQDISQKRHFFSIYNRIYNRTIVFDSLPYITGPSYGSKRGVYVLTSYSTAGAGEEFAYLIQTLQRGTVIGEITSSRLMHSKTFDIVGTDLGVTVPVINFIDNNGECWLGGGVVPDAIVLAEDAMDHAVEIAEFHKNIKKLIEGTRELLQNHYAFHKVALKVGEILQQKYAGGGYWSVVDYESLASQLTTDLQEASGDHRLYVFNCDVEPELLHEVPRIPTTEEGGYIIEALSKTKLLPGNIGYLRFDMMPDIEVVQAIAPQLLNKMWNKIVTTDTMIIDMRYNTGGYTTAIPLLCTYLFDHKPSRHLYTIFDRTSATMTEVTTYPQVMGQLYGSSKDIYILTSHMTGSAAEMFTRVLKDLHRATVIGEATIGGSLLTATYQIDNSTVYASIPSQAVLSAVTGKLWGVSGAEPDVAARAIDALSIAQEMIASKQKQ